MLHSYIFPDVIVVNDLDLWPALDKGSQTHFNAFIFTTTDQLIEFVADKLPGQLINLHQGY